ncbi:MAG: twin-arginine translocation signal domain-containing protein [Candidatus Hydrogenedens sp.]|nr:twin-arginine translocation signal domain-containing protein [Candidatus Hydrogenedens sp.]
MINGTSRRDFMRASGIAFGAALTGFAKVSGAEPNSETLRVGLIGCGGRGTGAVRQAILADPNTRLVALGDAFADNVTSALEKLTQAGSGIEDRVAVDADHQFAGLDAYKGVIDSCDVVVLAATPAFRPRHLRYAVESGKHVFCEKPIATCPTGVRHVRETCAMAKEKGLSLVSGLCYRYEHAKRDTMNQIHDGALGDIIAIETVYNTGGLWLKERQPDWTELEYQIRNWLYFYNLSGDHINEQHIHSLDKVAWAMGDVYPAKATSSGGRVQRTGEAYGNIYDHFNTTYEWESGVKAFSSCRQWTGSSTNVNDHIMGTKGTAIIQDHRIEFRDGTRWRHKKTGPDDMYQNEHDELFASIRSGEPINNGEYMCNSTLMAIMGRMAAYSGKTVTWEDAMTSDLNLMPADDLTWGDVDTAPVAVPGEV